jgi:chorismate mutase
MSLGHYRTEIDSIDKRIIALVDQRMKCSQQIGAIKAMKGMPIEHTDREASILATLYSCSTLDRDMIDDLYKLIFTFSKRYQDTG